MSAYYIIVLLKNELDKNEKKVEFNAEFCRNILSKVSLTKKSQFCELISKAVFSDNSHAELLTDESVAKKKLKVPELITDDKESYVIIPLLVQIEANDDQLKNKKNGKEVVVEVQTIGCNYFISSDREQGTPIANLMQIKQTLKVECKKLSADEQILLDTVDKVVQEYKKCRIIRESVITQIESIMLQCDADALYRCATSISGVPQTLVCQMMEIAADKRDPRAVLWVHAGYRSGQYGYPKDEAKANELLKKIGLVMAVQSLLPDCCYPKSASETDQLLVRLAEQVSQAYKSYHQLLKQITNDSLVKCGPDLLERAAQQLDACAKSSTCTKLSQDMRTMVHDKRKTDITLNTKSSLWRDEKPGQKIQDKKGEETIVLIEKQYKPG